MRTAIFVYEPTTVEIRTLDDQLQLEQLDTGAVFALSAFNQLTLGSGVYKLVSVRGVEVTADTTKTYVETTADDKDVFPQPRPQLLSGSLASLAMSAIQSFFVLARRW